MQSFESEAIVACSLRVLCLSVFGFYSVFLYFEYDFL